MNGKIYRSVICKILKEFFSLLEFEIVKQWQKYADFDVNQTFILNYFKTIAHITFR